MSMNMIIIRHSGNEWMHACMHIITIIPSSRLQVNFPFEVEISTVDKPEEREMKIQVISFFKFIQTCQQSTELFIADIQYTIDPVTIRPVWG